MKHPTMACLRAANPQFFSPDLGDYGAIKEHKLQQEGDSLLFKIHTKNNTRPVYLIEEDLTLTFIRQGW